MTSNVRGWHTSEFCSFAVIPAAGASRRMGRAKLLLQWRGRTIIEHVLAAWTASRVDRVVMVVSPNSGNRLSDLALQMGVEVIVPDEVPAQMKDSVRLGLRHVRETHSPQPSDAWLLAPADMPRLSARVIDCLLSLYDPSRPATLVPICCGRRGHPILLPFARAGEVEALPPERGVDAVIAAGQTVEVPVEDAGITEDLDTPEDFRRLDNPREST